MDRDELIRLVRRHAHPLDGLDDIDAVLALAARAHTVLLGEATHGTHEFYRMRALITRRLVVEHGFDAVAVESDWPDAARVNRYVQGAHDIADADDALAGYERFPRWMWRNEDVREFVAWLRRHDDDVPPERRAGFYGLDLYSLRASMDAVVRYLDGVDPQAARDARLRYACFDDFGDDPQRYGQMTRFGLSRTCEDEAVAQLSALLASGARRLQRDGAGAADALFHAQQNARVVKNAESYYRTMFDGHTASWNLRDTHMAQTLDELRVHLSAQRGRPARIVVWAHNSHVGDARATEPGAHGQITLGQLVRERAERPEETFTLGFTTHSGSVAAASDWDEPVELKEVRPSRPDSVERVLHDSGLGSLFLPLSGAVGDAFATPLLERAIGVVYRPDTERASHYFEAALSRQFDAVVHLHETTAVAPLDRSSLWRRKAEPETYPSGL